MDNLVKQIANIHFDQIQNIFEDLSENCAPNFNAAPANTAWSALRPSTISSSLTAEQSNQIVLDNRIDETDEMGEDWTAAKDLPTDDSSNSESYEDVPSTSAGYSSDLSDSSGRSESSTARRLLPRRQSKENSILKMNRRSIMKPTKRNDSKCDLRLADIKKLYMNKKLTKFRPSNLETIFEEPSDEGISEVESSQVRLVSFGSRKLRRSLSFCDGLNANKALIKKRRAKIKKTFGRRFALTKISLSDFHDRLNKSFDGSMADEELDDDSDVGNISLGINNSLRPAATALSTVTTASPSSTLANADIDERFGDGVLIKSNSFSGDYLTPEFR